MTPNLSLSYSSDAGTGWLGDRLVFIYSKNSIDTKWGVPQFLHPNRTKPEVYLLNGSVLGMEGDIRANRKVEDRGNAHTPARASGDVRFFERTRTSYKEIWCEDVEGNYFWEERLSDNTINYYGTKDGVNYRYQFGLKIKMREIS